MDIVLEERNRFDPGNRRTVFEYEYPHYSSVE